MKTWLMSLMVRLLRRWGYEEVLVSRDIVGLSERMRPMVQQWEQQADVSGEYRRSRIYQTMVRTYPDVPRWWIGLALELAVMRERTR